jgi:5-methylcytosine-specific restriction endonuclease McrA
VKPWAGAHAGRDRHAEARLRREVVGYWKGAQWVQGSEFICWRCRRPATSPDDQLGHVVALADGGTTTRENCHREHQACNQRAGSELGARRMAERSAARG